LHRLDHELRFLEPKTARSRRSVPLPGLCIDALRDHAKRQEAERDAARVWTDSGLVFTTPIGAPIDPRNFSRMFAGWCERGEVPVVRMHDLRHTCVTLLLSLGVPPRVVMEIAGHSALEMTMNVYGHVALDDQRQALDRLNGLLDDE
jgi:integrase